MTATETATETAPAGSPPSVTLDDLRLVMAGRTFRSAVPRTMGQKEYWDLCLRRAGVRTPPTTLAEWDAVVGQFEATDQLKHLVACTLVEERPDGTRAVWRRADADANAEFFWGLTDPADLAQLQIAIGQELLRFFPLGRTSPATSPNSLLASTAPPGSPASTVPSPGTSATTPAGSVTSAAGASSSDASPAIPTTSTGS